MAVQKTFSPKKTASKPKKSFKPYLTTMRKITNRINVEEVTKLNRSMRITFTLNAHLCQQAENMLKSQWTRDNYTYPSLSELIRRSLMAYQEGKIKINLLEREKNVPKREISVRFSLNPSLLNFYFSLPEGQRTAIIEESLKVYLERLGMS
jgi:hypothetical protein